MSSFSLAVALAVVAMTALFLLARRGDLDGTAARKLVSEGAHLVDVRSPAEFASGHLPGAINVPVGELSRRAGELPKDEPVVVYCRSGARSRHAAQLLRAQGHQAVHDLGAMSRW